MNPLPSLVTTVCGFFELGVPVSAVILVFGAFLRVYGRIRPRRGRGGSPRGSTCNTAWGNQGGTKGGRWLGLKPNRHALVSVARCRRRHRR